MYVEKLHFSQLDLKMASEFCLSLLSPSFKSLLFIFSQHKSDLVTYLTYN